MPAVGPRGRMPRLLLGALAAGQVAYGLDRRRQSPAATRALLGLAAAASLAEARSARGARAVAGMAVAGGIGLLAELAGVATGRPFGRYAYSERLGPRVREVPLLVPVAWAAMARPAWVTAGWLSPDPRRRVPAAAAALAAWDLFLDPRMVEQGYWRWEAGGRYAGVPASNYRGWVLTGLLIFSLTAVLDGEPVAPGDDLALALYGWTWIGETFANAVLWRRPLPAIAGGLGMGAAAAPALRRRRRRGGRA
jgi:uncharacterized membrane protein